MIEQLVRGNTDANSTSKTQHDNAMIPTEGYICILCLRNWVAYRQRGQQSATQQY